MLKTRWFGPLGCLGLCAAMVALGTGCPPGLPQVGNANNANRPPANNNNATPANNNNAAPANNNNAAPANMNNANGGGGGGDVESGRTLFTSSTCSSCHDASGVGGNVATGADVRDFTTADAVQVRMMEVSFHSGFIGNLTPDDFANLAAFFESLP